MKPTTILLGFLFIFQTATAQDDFWEHLNTPGGVNFWDIEHVTGDIIVASSMASGLYISYDNGDTWEESTFEHGCQDLEAGPSGYLYLEKYPGHVLWYSPDTCKTWIESNSFFNPWVITIHADEDNTVYVGADGRVFRSLDTCKTWQQVMRNPNTQYTTDINRNPVTGNIYATFAIIYENNHGLYGSSTGDSGTWVTKNMPGNYAMKIDFNDEGNIFIGSKGDVDSKSFNGLYRSTDNCQTWEGIFNNNVVYSILNIPEGTFIGCPIYYGTGGVYYKADEDSMFHRTPTTLAVNNIWNMTLSKNHLFVADHSAGLFRSVEPVTNVGIRKLKNERKLQFKVFPNPIFEGQNLNIVSKGSKEIKKNVILYNLHGKKIKTKSFNKKINTITLSTAGLQSGVYLIKMQKGGKYYVKKILINK